MKSFIYRNARSREEAVRLLSRDKVKTKVIAGGTDLLGMMKDHILPDYPESIINIKTIAGLEYIKEEKTGLSIGALTKLADIVKSPVIKKNYKVLADAARSVASPIIRNMATIGGNLAQDVRCWYYRYSMHIGGPIVCLRKGGKLCNALPGDNRYHSIFGAARLTDYPCSSNCPAHTDIPSYLDKVKNEDYREAAEILLNYNPIPAITGRICPVFCEPKCNRDEFDEPVAIRCIERAVGDYILENADGFFKPPSTGSGKKTAVIGSGPAGLSAAFYLRRQGHAVTVFEKLPEPGGMLLYGIPPYRLPKDVVRKQIQVLENMGITFKVNTGAGRDIAIAGLMKEFDALFLASGAWKEVPLGIKGEHLAQSGLEFLNSVNTGEKKIPGKRVGIIGGGNVAMDAARTLLRLGAEPVVIYRRSRNEMPALRHEVEKAMEEGIRFEFLTMPARASKADGAIELMCVRTKPGSPGSSGRPKAVAITGSEFSIRVDAVIKAIGEKPDHSILPGTLRQKTRKKLSSPSLLGRNLFIGGDFATGSSAVIQAAASGREVALLMDMSFHKGVRKDPAATACKSGIEPGFAVPSFEDAPRIRIPELSVTERASLDIEDVQSSDISEIRAEARRCFNCGCLAICPSDIGTALVALDALIITSKRTMDAQTFFTPSANSSTVLENDELITGIRIPGPQAGTRQSYIKFTLRKPVDFALVSVASVIRVKEGLCTDARIVLGSVGPAPVRAKTAEDFLKGRSIDEETAAKAGGLAIEGAMPLSMNGYKLEIAKTLVKRSILESMD